MSRPIKFRAWDGSEMTYDVLAGKEGNVCDHDGESVWFWHEPPKAIMQFTGLHDKNGKEIWEGDVVLWGGNFKCPVIFKDGAFQIEVKDKHGIDSCPLAFCEKDFEVLGNVHENPNLLTKREQ